MYTTGKVSCNTLNLERNSHRFFSKGQTTKLYDTAFTTIPGSPAYVSKALKYKAKNPVLGFDINLQNNNAIQGHFRFQG
jgi:hypothetical protein